MDECIRRDLDKAQDVHDLAIMVMAQITRSPKGIAEMTIHRSPTLCWIYIPKMRNLYNIHYWIRQAGRHAEQLSPLPTVAHWYLRDEPREYTKLRF